MFISFQVNTLAIKNYLAAGGFQSIRLYDLNSSTNPIINFEGKKTMEQFKPSCHATD